MTSPTPPVPPAIPVMNIAMGGARTATVIDYLTGSNASTRLGAHMEVLAKIFKNTGTTVTTGVGVSPDLRMSVLGKAVDLPVFHREAGIFMLGGNKFAAMQTARWNGASYQFLSAEDVLVERLHSVAAEVQGLNPRQAATRVQRAIHGWRDEVGQFVRAAESEAGGALAYHLSRTAVISNPNDPIYQHLAKAEGLAKEMSRLKGPKLLHTRARYLEEKMKAAALVAQHFPGFSMESLALTGQDAFKHVGYVDGVPGRITGLSLIHDSEMAGPIPNFNKSRHHTRARLAMDLKKVAKTKSGRWSDADKVGKRLYTRTTPLVTSNERRAMSKAAAAHRVLMGTAKGKRKTILETPARVFAMRMREDLIPHLSEAEQRTLYKYINSFGDSVVYSGDTIGDAIIGLSGRTNTIKLAVAPSEMSNLVKGGTGEVASAINPALAPYLAQMQHDTIYAGQDLGGGLIFPKEGISYDDIKGIIGQDVTSGGVATGPVVNLPKNDVIVGIKKNRSGFRFITKNKRRLTQVQTGLTLNDARRGLGGPVVGTGPELANIVTTLGSRGTELDINTRLYTAAQKAQAINTHGGGMGVLARHLGVGVKQFPVDVTESGQKIFERSLNLGDKRLSESHILKAIAGAEAELGVSLGPTIHQGVAGYDDFLLRGDRALLGEVGNIAKKLNLSTGEMFEMVDMIQNVAGRAGQGHRGKPGAVNIRLRDMKMEAMRLVQLGGGDAESAFAAFPGMRDEISRMHGQAARNARSHLRYSRATLRAAKAGLGGTVKGAMSAADYVANVVGSHGVVTRSGLRSGDDLSRLAGTPYVKLNKAGEWVPTNAPTIVELPVPGAIPDGAYMGTKGAGTRYAVLPSGRQLGLRKGQKLRFNKVKMAVNGEMVDVDSPLTQALRLHEAVSTGRWDEAYQHAGSYSLFHRAQALGNKGWMKRSYGFKPVASKTLTLGTGNSIIGSSQIMPHQIGITWTDLREMGISKKLYKKTVKKHGALRIRSKVEPSLDLAHFSYFDVVPLNDTVEVSDNTAKLGYRRMSRVGAAFVNPDIAERINRDFDYDQIMTWLQANPKQYGAFMREQEALKEVMPRMMAEHQAAARAGAEYVAAKMMMPKVDSKIYEQQLQDTLMSIERTLGNADGSTSREILERALGMVNTSVPKSLTGNAYSQWKSAGMNVMNIIDMVRDGITHEELFTPQQLQRAASRNALEYLQSNASTAVRAFDLMKAAQNLVLKKGVVADALVKGSGNMAEAMPDAQLLAAYHGMVEQPTPKGYAKQIDHMAGIIEGVLGTAQGDPLSVAADSAGVNMGDAAKVAEFRNRTSRQIAETLYHTKMLELGGIRAPMMDVMTNHPQNALSMNGLSRLINGRSFEGAADVIADASYYGGHSLDVAEAARRAGDDIVKEGMHGIKARAKSAAEGAARIAEAFSGKTGKYIAMGAAAAGGLAFVGSLFGGSSGPVYDVGTGSPLPPPPMLNGPGMDRSVPFISPPSMDYANVERVQGMRTHFQGNAPSYQDFDTVMVGGFSSMRSHGRVRNVGSISSSGNNPMHRHEMDALIRTRMRSGF